MLKLKTEASFVWMQCDRLAFH